MELPAGARIHDSGGKTGAEYTFYDGERIRKYETSGYYY